MARHGALSTLFDSLSEDALLDVIDGGEARMGWGITRTIEIDGHKILVKTLPVTAVEIDSYPSTANLFELPVVYQYGVGSAGFGSGRELAAHLATTKWVLDGRIEHFPLLYHQRLLPLAQQTRRFEDAQLDRYIKYWDDDAAIRRFIEARQSSEHAIMLFIEHFPHVLMDWLPEHQDAVGQVIDQALAVTDFLRDQDVGHFDANPSNIVTDGDRIYFADFGLFLDERFDLSDAEQSFRANHRYFDIAEFIASLEWPVPGREFEPGAGYRAALEPYREVVDEMTGVFERLRTGPKNRAGYLDSRMAQMLTAARL
jgi:tRNA A-37 threonylcarbamoyl transferase component Bud32